ncbi:MAG: SpoIIE family protein phosphatase [Bacteroidetes bacterium]|nr:SpoIIE family protein phosphatase [Bacteroidota bacterium]
MYSLRTQIACAITSLLLLVSTGASLRSQELVEGKYRYDVLALEDGLSQGMIFCILQDSRGFLWFGTKEGLNRYDGATFTVFRNIPGDTTSLPDNQVYSLAEDEHGRIWVGTRTGGLQLFNPVSETFTSISIPGTTPGSTNSASIHHLFIDNSGTLWVGGWKRLLAHFNTQELTIKGLDASSVNYHEDTRFHSLQAFKLSEGRPGRISILTEHALWMQHDGTGDFERALDWKALGLPIDESNTEIIDGTTDRHAAFWLSIRIRNRFALLRIDIESRQILDTLRFPYQDADLVPRSIVFGNDDILYCSASNYFLRYNPQSRTFSVTQPDPNGIGKLHGGVSSLHFDRSGMLWIGTTGLGVHAFNPRTLLFGASTVPLKLQLFGKEIRAFETYLRHRYQIKRITLASLHPFRATDGSLWCGTSNYGLLHYDPVAERVRQYGFTTSDPYNMLLLRLSTPFVDSQNRVWIGNTQGLSRLVDKPEQWEHYFFDTDKPDLTRREDNVICFHEDEDGTLWLGTISSGLVHFTPADASYRFFRHDPRNPQSITSNHVLSVTADPLMPGRYLWVGTDGGGLNRFDKLEHRFDRFGIDEGLPNMVIYGILTDESGLLWMSSNNGISCLDPQTLQFLNFSVRDGLQDREFNRTEYFSIPPRLYFGGVEGHNSFDPSEIRRNRIKPTVTLTGLRLFNRALSLSTHRDILSVSIPYATELQLSHEQNMLTFEFAALDFTDPGNNRYRYRLHGLDRDWIVGGNERSATYTNLAPGEYTFQVIASNNHGTWNEEGASLRIVILPPWWQSFWAYAAYGIVLVAFIFMVDRLQRHRVVARERHRSEIREAKLRAGAAELEARAVRAENEKNGQDLRVAAAIQKRVIPQSLPRIPGFDIAGINHPAHEIGGDYYNCIPVGDDRFALVIADVTGKGIPASLLVNSLHASLLVYLDNDLSLEDLIVRLNRLIHRTSTPNTFITFLLVLLQPSTGKIETINAGHHPAIVLTKDGRLEIMKSRGLPLGCSIDVMQYESQTRIIEAGESVLLYTDGITEAMNERQVAFGQETLEDILLTHHNREPSVVLTALTERLRSFRGAAPQSDDITMLYLRRNPPSAHLE